MRRWIAAAGAVLLAGCGGSAGSGAGKYDQTWPKQYAATTCAEFENAMTPQQRFAAAADMLAGARDTGDGGTGVPPDSLIDQFKAAVDGACEAQPTMALTEAAVGVYLNDRATYRP